MNKKKRDGGGAEGEDEGFESDPKANGDSKDSTLERATEAETMKVSKYRYPSSQMCFIYILDFQAHSNPCGI